MLAPKFSLLLAALPLLASLCDGVAAATAAAQPESISLVRVPRSPAASRRRSASKSSTRRHGRFIRRTDVSTPEDNMWAVPITVGKSKLNVEMDTGSFQLFLEPGKYQPGPNSQDLSENVESCYGVGSENDCYKADLYNDDIELGGLKTHATFGTVAAGIGHVADGLFGMGPVDSANKPDTHNVISSLKSSGALKGGEFVLDLHPKGGTLTLSSPNDKGSFGYAPYQGESYMVSGSVNGLQVTGLFDTGDWTISASASGVKKLAEGLGLQTTHDDTVLIVGPCDSHPQVVFNFGGMDVPLNKDAIWQEKHDDEGNCVMSVRGWPDVEDNNWFFGAPIFLSAQIAFDLNNAQVGVKPKGQ